MSPQLIAQIIIAISNLPVALQVISDLANIWKKETLTPEEVIAFCDKSKKNYDEYIAEARNITPVV